MIKCLMFTTRGAVGKYQYCLVAIYKASTVQTTDYRSVTSCYLTRHFFVRHTLSEMENFKFQFYVSY